MKKYLSITNITKTSCISSRACLANTFFSRLKGLLGRNGFKGIDGFFIPKCRAVHTFFMQFPIDIICINKDFRVIRIVRNLQPYKNFTCLLATHGVIELPEGMITSTKTELGDYIEMKNND